MDQATLIPPSHQVTPAADAQDHEAMRVRFSDDSEVEIPAVTNAGYRLWQAPAALPKGVYWMTTSKAGDKVDIVTKVDRSDLCVVRLNGKQVCQMTMKTWNETRANFPRALAFMTEIGVALAEGRVTREGLTEFRNDTRRRQGLKVPRETDGSDPSVRKRPAATMSQQQQRQQQHPPPPRREPEQQQQPQRPQQQQQQSPTSQQGAPPITEHDSSTPPHSRRRISCKSTSQASASMPAPPPASRGSTTPPQVMWTAPAAPEIADFMNIDALGLATEAAHIV